VIVNLAFFQVANADEPPPFGGDPSPDQVMDSIEVLSDVHFELERSEDTLEHAFAVDHPEGLYYLQVRVFLFRKGHDGMTAQAEQFFFGKRPVPIPCQGVTMPIPWPDIPIESLHTYGAIHPRKRPWWRFW
jgi:hypothetical protein